MGIELKLLFGVFCQLNKYLFHVWHVERLEYEKKDIMDGIYKIKGK